MHCPFCKAEKESLKVIDSRTCEGGRSIRRRRECLSCAKRFTTYERIEQTVRLTVVKKDGRRVPWDREKILDRPGTGVLQAAGAARAKLMRMADEVEEEVFATYDREVPSTVIGKLVTERLRRLDQVAYVRFASVYRQFKTLEELVDEAQAVLDARRYEDPPGQGRLFLEPPGTGRPDNGKRRTTPPHRRRAAARPRAPRRDRGPRAEPAGTASRRRRCCLPVYRASDRCYSRPFEKAARVAGSRPITHGRL